MNLEKVALRACLLLDSLSIARKSAERTQTTEQAQNLKHESRARAAKPQVVRAPEALRRPRSPRGFAEYRACFSLPIFEQKRDCSQSSLLPSLTGGNGEELTDI